MSVFGPLISGYDVEQRVQDTLKFWLDTYLQEREFRTGRDCGSVARPKSWRTIRTFDEMNPEDQTPFIAIVSDGLAHEPVAEGDGSYIANWVIGVGVVISARSEAEAQILTKDIYLPTIRQLLLHKQSLRDWSDSTAEEWSDGIDWTDESYDEVASDMERTLYNGQLTFEVRVANVVTRSGGPREPSAPCVEEGDWPIAETGNVEVEV